MVQFCVARVCETSWSRRGRHVTRPQRPDWEAVTCQIRLVDESGETRWLQPPGSARELQVAKVSSCHDVRARHQSENDVALTPGCQTGLILLRVALALVLALNIVAQIICRHPTVHGHNNICVYLLPVSPSTAGETKRCGIRLPSFPGLPWESEGLLSDSFPGRNSLPAAALLRTQQ